MPNEDDLKARQISRVYEQFYHQLDARMPQLYLELLRRVETLEQTNQGLHVRIDELEHQVRKLKQQL